jgi:hypothetical protein
MDPITLGAVVAALFAKKLIERLGERAGDKVADEVTPVREQIMGLLEGAGHDTGVVQQVEQASDSKIAVGRLATAITQAAEQNPDGAQRLAEFMAQYQLNAKEQQVAKFQVNLRDEAKVERIYNADRDIIFKAD